MATKVVLKSTTKLSLNERFSAYRKNVIVGGSANIRNRIQQMQQASARNRRLAIQMENRPSVIAALKLKKKSLKQRLGNQQYRGTGNRVQINRGGRGIFTRGNRGGLRRENFSPKRGISSAGRMARRGRGMGSGRGRGNQNVMTQFRSRGVQRNARRGFRGRGRGRGGRGGIQKIPTKQQLDSELDIYMANSKSQLDSELDAYMADAS